MRELRDDENAMIENFEILTAALQHFEQDLVRYAKETHNLQRDLENKIELREQYFQKLKLLLKEAIEGLEAAASLQLAGQELGFKALALHLRKESGL